MQLLAVRLDLRDVAVRSRASFLGPAIRQQLGPAMRASHCLRRCERGPCQVPHDCLAGRSNLVPGAATPRWRLDASELDPRPAMAALRFVGPAAERGVLQALSVAARRSLEGDGSAWTVSATVAAIHLDLLDLGVRARELTGDVVIAVRTPFDVRRNPGAGSTEATSESVFDRWTKSVHRRLIAWGIVDPDGPLPPRPALADDAWEALSVDRKPQRHRSHRQGRSYPVGGRVGEWRVEADAGTAWWLAAAEAVGVGRGATRGNGVVRCCRVDRST